MGAFAGPEIAESGLVLALDVGNTKSYPGSGTTWTDLSGNGNNGTLVNSVAYSASNGGSLSFDGVDDYVSLTSADLRFGGSNSYTFDFFIKVPHSTTNQTIFSNGNLSTNGIIGVLIEAVKELSEEVKELKRYK